MNLDDLERWSRWERALEQFDLGNREPLADLVREGVEIPERLREPLAAIVAGTRRPQRGKGKQKLTYAARDIVTKYQLPYYALVMSVKYGALTEEELAGSKAGYRALLRDLRERGIKAAMEKTGLSERTVRGEWSRQIKEGIRRMELSRLKRLSAMNRPFG